MNKAFSAIELLFVLVIIVILSLFFFKSGSGRTNPFEEQVKIKSQSQIIDEKINSIEETKALKNKIERNLKGDY